jgi:hypothetical protein
VEDDARRALGRALAWARQNGLATLDVVVDGDDVDSDDAAGVLARRAELFAAPPGVWRLRHRTLVPATPSPFPVAAPLDPDVEGLVGVIAAAGAAPVVEHGTLVGEVEGLEVVRAVPADADADAGAGARLEIGVGRHDREASALLYADVPVHALLAEVVGRVRRHRSPGAEPHPLNRLAPERALRARVLADPALVGAAELRAAPPPVPRAGVKERVPAVAAGVDPDGGATVVVCSVGIDLDLVPFAADARLAASSEDARLVLAVPPRDVHPVTVALAGALRRPAEVRSVG